MNEPRRPAMLFVDGSNFLIELAREIDLPTLRADQPSVHAINYANQVLNNSLGNALHSVPFGPYRVVRRYWFGSVKGGEDVLESQKQTLRTFGFEGILFRSRNGREKGVDLAVAREMLIHAFNRNYEAAVLVAGDEDYYGLVQDVKRLGPTVVGAFFDNKALAGRLKNAFDTFCALSPFGFNQEFLGVLKAEHQR